MKKLIALVSPILVVFTLAQTLPLCAAKTLFMGTIQFPKQLITIPDIRIYYGGNIIKHEKQSANNSISFSFPEDKRRTKFHVLVTETIKFTTKDNTIEGIKIPSNKSYKFYELDLIKTENPELPLDSIKNESPLYSWSIKQHDLFQNKVPDDAVIICYTPEYVQCLEGGSAIQLPKIVIKDNVLELAGSESNLLDSSIALLLSSLDSDAIHTNIHQEVKQDFQHKRITIVT